MYLSRWFDAFNDDQSRHDPGTEKDEHHRPLHLTRLVDAWTSIDNLVAKKYK